MAKTEEKSSDGSLPPTYSRLQDACNVLVVISNDSDLKLPIEVAQGELWHLEVCRVG